MALITAAAQHDSRLTTPRLPEASDTWALFVRNSCRLLSDKTRVRLVGSEVRVVSFVKYMPYSVYLHTTAM